MIGTFEKYLIIVNIVGFVLYFINYLLYKHTTEGQIDNVLTIFALAGGALGMVVGILIFDRKPEKDNMMSRVFIICIFIIWVVVFLIIKGFIKTKLSFAFWDFFANHKIFLIYLIVMNIVTMVAFAIDKIAALEHRSRIRIITLLGLSIIGGSIGALIGMYLFHHKTRKDYFSVGVPLIIIMQIVVIFYLMNAQFIK